VELWLGVLVDDLNFVALFSEVDLIGVNGEGGSVSGDEDELFESEVILVGGDGGDAVGDDTVDDSAFLAIADGSFAGDFDFEYGVILFEVLGHFSCGDAEGLVNEPFESFVDISEGEISVGLGDGVVFVIFEGEEADGVLDGGTVTKAVVEHCISLV
jgi:hypothetical protein